MNVSIDQLEAYLANHYNQRANEQSMFMKLVEEIGEVAEVLNKRAGRKASDDSDLTTELGTELADVIHYAVAIAAINQINLTEIILQKDKIASVKYHHEIDLATFIHNHKND